MTEQPWPEEEIRRLATISGRPLEVQCGELFVKRGWSVRLGTYFVDGTTERLREVDVLATKQKVRGGITKWVRAFISVKGFKHDQVPATYSVAASSQMLAPPTLLSSYSVDLLGSGDLGAIARQATGRLLESSPLQKVSAPGEAAIGLDIFERKPNRKKKQENSDLLSDRWDYARQTDRALYEGLDSALKAAAFWMDLGRQRQNHAALYVPVLITASPFWNVRIDGPNEQNLREAAFIAGMYPVYGAMRSILSLMASVSSLDTLIRALDSLVEWFELEDVTRARIDG